MKKTLFIIFVGLVVAGTVYAAPYFSYQRTMLPIDATEDIGTSTAPWDRGFFNILCLSGSCNSSWPDSFSTTSANYFIHSSSTIPKTYTTNIFTGTNSFIQTLNLNGLTNNGWATTTNLAVTGTGTSTIAGNLDVAGNVKAGLAMLPATIYSTGNATIGGVISVNGAGNNYFAGNIGIGTTSPSATLHINTTSGNSLQIDGANTQRYLFGSTGAFSISAGTGSTVFTVTNSGAGDLVNIGSGKLYVTSAGNVGIGTTSPLYKLSVVGDIFTSQDTSTYFRATALNNNAIAGSIYTTGNGASLQAWQLASNASGANGEFTIRDSTAGVTALTISKATGNVGIGTTTPNNLLSVEKTQNADTLIDLNNFGTGANSRSVIRFGENQTTKNGGMGYGNNSYNAGAGAELLRANALQIYTNSGASGGISIDAAASAGYITFGTGGFATANERMRIDSAGNVGIGTTAPSTKLEVVGTTTSTFGDIGFPVASLSSSQDQTLTAANTVYPITFNTNDLIKNITHSTSVDNATTTIDYAGTYELIFSAIAQPTSVNDHISIWLNVNNVNIANSATYEELTNGEQTIVAAALMYTFAAGDKFQIQMATDAGGTFLDATSAGTIDGMPTSPSVILTIKKVSK